MENLARLHRALIDALLQNRPGTLDQPVTVAEIYQDLIPYRSVRSTLGFALNADYEHALLQLLAGMDGHARIEPVEVREALRLELESPNPNVGMFRNYAACDVHVTVPEDAGRNGSAQRYDRAASPSTAPEPEEPPRTPPQNRNWESVLNTGAAPDPADAARDFAPRHSSTQGPLQPGAPERSRANFTQPQHPPSVQMSGATCVNCQKNLPGDRRARFCPECGYDQSKRLCRSCREPLEEGWRFCIKCGVATA